MLASGATLGSVRPGHLLAKNAFASLSRLLQYCYRCEVPGKRHIRAHEHAIATGHCQTHALIMRVAKTDGEAASFHFSCEIEDAEDLHAIRRHRVFIMDDSNVAKAEGLY